MRTRAAAKGRRLFFIAAVCLASALLLSPAAEASRSLPAAIAPVLEAPATPGQILEAELTEPPERLRLFDDLRLPPRPLELVEARKTASGSSTYTLGLNVWQTGGLGRIRGGLSFQGLWHDPLTEIAYARNRWYDARTAHWLSPDPMGAFDSPNQYAFVAWGPHMYTDPTGEYIEAPLEIISIGMGATSFAYNMSQGEYGWAALDAIGVVADSALLLVPGAPGVVGSAIQGGKAAAKGTQLLRTGARAAQWGTHVADVAEGAVLSRQAFQEGNDGWGYFYAGMSAFGGYRGFVDIPWRVGGDAVSRSWARFNQYRGKGIGSRGQFLEDAYRTKMTRQGASVFRTQAGRMGIDLGTVERGSTVLSEVKFYKGRVSANEITSFGLHHAPGVTSQRALRTNIRRAIRGAEDVGLDDTVQALRRGNFGVRFVGGPKTMFAQDEIQRRLLERGIRNVEFTNLSRLDIWRYILRGGGN